MLRQLSQCLLSGTYATPLSCHRIFLFSTTSDLPRSLDVFVHSHTICFWWTWLYTCAEVGSVEWTGSDMEIDVSVDLVSSSQCVRSPKPKLLNPQTQNLPSHAHLNQNGSWAQSRPHFECLSGLLWPCQDFLWGLSVDFLWAFSGGSLHTTRTINLTMTAAVSLFAAIFDNESQSNDNDHIALFGDD